MQASEAKLTAVRLERAAPALVANRQPVAPVREVIRDPVGQIQAAGARGAQAPAVLVLVAAVPAEPQGQEVWALQPACRDSPAQVALLEWQVPPALPVKVE